VTIKFSVIVCTHDPRKEYLSRTLDGLRAQTMDKSLWELLLIDNASKEPLKRWVLLDWHPSARIIEEPVLGVLAARLRGVAESVGEVLVFVDDDNILMAEYLENAQSIAMQWPQLGVWGGQQKPEFEEQPAQELLPYIHHLAIRSLENDVWAKLPGLHEALPWGAGMCFRRNVAIQWSTNVRDCPIRKKLGRTGTSLTSGVGEEDTDLALTAFDVGLGTGLFRCLTLTHLISMKRVNEQYLLNMIEAKGFSRVLLEFARGNNDVLRKPTLLSRFLKWYGRIRSKSRLTARVMAAHERGHDRAIKLLKM
jgi:glycosyltransferase involved in cell wall biosynthesis